MKKSVRYMIIRKNDSVLNQSHSDCKSWGKSFLLF